MWFITIPETNCTTILRNIIISIDIKCFCACFAVLFVCVSVFIMCISIETSQKEVNFIFNYFYITKNPNVYGLLDNGAILL